MDTGGTRRDARTAGGADGGTHARTVYGGRTDAQSETDGKQGKPGKGVKMDGRRGRWTGRPTRMNRRRDKIRMNRHPQTVTYGLQAMKKCGCLYIWSDRQAGRKAGIMRHASRHYEIRLLYHVIFNNIALSRSDGGLAEWQRFTTPNLPRATTTLYGSVAPRCWPPCPPAWL